MRAARGSCTPPAFGGLVVGWGGERAGRGVHLGAGTLGALGPREVDERDARDLVHHLLRAPAVSTGAAGGVRTEVVSEACTWTKDRGGHVRSVAAVGSAKGKARKDDAPSWSRCWCGSA
jgi:hypothetical protein